MSQNDTSHGGCRAMAPDRPRLSIITVCRNEAARIRQTAESVVGQTWQEFEWIVMDGGSTDGTQEILNEYRPRMTHYASGPDNGIYDAMNNGIQLASGDYILFLNGGDRLHDGEVIQNVMPLLGSADVVYGVVNLLDEAGIFQQEFRVKETSVSPKAFFCGNTIPHPGAFIRRSLFQQYGYYDTQYKIIADLVFFGMLSKNHRTFKMVPLTVADFFLGGISSHANHQELVQLELTKWRKAKFPVRFIRRWAKRTIMRVFHRP